MSEVVSCNQRFWGRLCNLRLQQGAIQCIYHDPFTLNKLNFIDLIYPSIFCGHNLMNYAYLQAMKVFMCKNCEHEKYQCFACGCLGSAKADPPEVNPFREFHS